MKRSVTTLLAYQNASIILLYMKERLVTTHCHVKPGENIARAETYIPLREKRLNESWMGSETFANFTTISSLGTMRLKVKVYIVRLIKVSNIKSFFFFLKIHYVLYSYSIPAVSSNLTVIELLYWKKPSKTIEKPYKKTIYNSFISHILYYAAEAKIEFFSVLLSNIPLFLSADLEHFVTRITIYYL